MTKVDLDGEVHQTGTQCLWWSVGPIVQPTRNKEKAKSKQTWGGSQGTLGILRNVVHGSHCRQTETDTLGNDSKCDVVFSRCRTKDRFGVHVLWISAVKYGKNYQV